MTTSTGMVIWKRSDVLVSMDDPKKRTTIQAQRRSGTTWRSCGTQRQAAPAGRGHWTCLGASSAAMNRYWKSEISVVARGDSLHGEASEPAVARQRGRAGRALGPSGAHAPQHGLDRPGVAAAGDEDQRNVRREFCQACRLEDRWATWASRWRGRGRRGRRLGRCRGRRRRRAPSRRRHRRRQPQIHRQMYVYVPLRLTSPPFHPHSSMEPILLRR